jgi:hypothetical protein
MSQIGDRTQNDRRLGVRGQRAQVAQRIEAQRFRAKHHIQQREIRGVASDDIEDRPGEFAGDRSIACIGQQKVTASRNSPESSATNIVPGMVAPPLRCAQDYQDFASLCRSLEAHDMRLAGCFITRR